MKLIIYVILCFFKLYIASVSENTMSTENHFSMMMRMKAKTKVLLNNLYTTANKVELLDEENNYKKEKDSDDDFLSFLQSEAKRRASTENKLSYTSKHISKISIHILKKYKKNKEKFIQYRYKNYDEIEDELRVLEKKYPQYLKITTGQKLYKLPHPGGYCKTAKGERRKCDHFIAFLSNHKIDKKHKPQIYFSGEVHGDERVGPTATLELIRLLLENKDSNPWFQYLLDTRYIVITPMTNPHGYYDKIREELLIKDEDEIPLTQDLYFQTHKDINRDFPYLTDEASCMETIGARLVNELFIDHVFSLALSLHGGTESLTYPYGTPNHLVTDLVSKIPMKYELMNGKLNVTNSTDLTEAIKPFRNKTYEMLMANSTNPPDYNTIRGIAETATKHTTENPKHQYPIGDMSGMVYSVTGGMEDWAYSGSWEGSPIITQSCKPTTYNGYAPLKTSYDSNHKDALKSIMFLLEVSKDKAPELKHLGRKNLDCIINLRSNAFFNGITKDKILCLDEYIDGYIPRIIRLSLTLIDLLHPYINYRIKENKDSIEVEWAVGGSISVDSTYIVYDYFPNKLNNAKSNRLRNQLDSEDLDSIKKYLKLSTDTLAGKGIWNVDFAAKDNFKQTLQKKENNTLVFMVIANVDSSWGKKNNPDPDINPQTHIANLRTNGNYTASNYQFELKGSSFFKSKLEILKFSNNHMGNKNRR